jgi:hypothetical protein
MLFLVALVEALLAAASPWVCFRRWCFAGAGAARTIPAMTVRRTAR